MSHKSKSQKVNVSRLSGVSVAMNTVQYGDAHFTVEPNLK